MSKDEGIESDVGEEVVALGDLGGSRDGIWLFVSLLGSRGPHLLGIA